MDRRKAELACDVLVIGGGVLGTAIAARLSRTSARVVLVEAEPDLAEGASKGNAGIASCFYGDPGTLESRLIGASVHGWEELCRNLDVPYRRMGALMVALNPEQAQELPRLRDMIAAHGARAQLMSAREARRDEPMIAPDCQGAISLPDEGIIDPMRLTIGFAELAARNGARIQLSTRVIGFESRNGHIEHAETPAGWILPRFVVNVSGLFSDDVSAMAGGERFRMWPRKGQYWLLDREFGSSLSRIIFPVPQEHTRGIQVVPTTNGSTLLGPTASDGDDRFDKSTDGATLTEIFEAARALVPAVSLDFAIKSFSALRPASDEPFRARFDRIVGNLVHVGSRSAGVSLSPALADHVLGLLRDAGLDASDRAEATQAIPSTKRLLSDPRPEDLPRIDPLYQQVICACEQVTAAEIVAALTSEVPARSIDGIRKRTRATAGRCQGSICMTGVAFLCSLHTGQPPYAIRYGRSDGTLGIGSARG
jgi:glycerol-3-phosphate dehydrogenase